MNAILIGERKNKKSFAMSVSNDPFYSRNNIEYLEKVTSEIDNGTAKLEEHELIEI